MYTDIRSYMLCHITDAAEILEPSEERTEHNVEGQNSTLTCIGVGHPPPLVQWRKLNGSLSDRVTSINMSMSTNEGNITRVTVELILTNISREDSGDYECLASNILNNATRNVSLIVQCMYMHFHMYINALCRTCMITSSIYYIC